MIYVLMLVAGLGVLGWNTWQRLGRTSAARSWSRGMRSGFVRRNVLVLWPLLGGALVLGGVVGLLGDTVPVLATLFPLLMLLTLVLWLAYAALPLPVPRWVRPAWHRQLEDTPGRSEARRD